MLPPIPLVGILYVKLNYSFFKVCFFVEKLYVLLLWVLHKNLKNSQRLSLNSDAAQEQQILRSRVSVQGYRACPLIPLRFQPQVLHHEAQGHKCPPLPDLRGHQQRNYPPVHHGLPAAVAQDDLPPVKGNGRLPAFLVPTYSRAEALNSRSCKPGPQPARFCSSNPECGSAIRLPPYG